MSVSAAASRGEIDEQERRDDRELHLMTVAQRLRKRTYPAKMSGRPLDQEATFWRFFFFSFSTKVVRFMRRIWAAWFLFQPVRSRA